jgi:hypothetical protein
VFAEVWTSTIGLVNTQNIDAGAQKSDHVLNLAVPANQLLNFDASVWARRFYSIFADQFDFLNFVHVGGARGNRYHVQVKNDVSGIGAPLQDASTAYGSLGRLLGYSVFPLSNLFDAGETGFNHETGHQWINFLQGTPFASGIPHWPKGNVAINTMGFSIPGSGGVGGTYGFTFQSNGQGGYVTGAADPANVTMFNSMELYLMGLVPASDVGSYFVLKDQNRNLGVGDTLLPSDITVVTVGDIIAAVGPRTPDSTSSPKIFHSATVVLSEELLDPYALSLYDWFARRGEETQMLACSSGFLQSICRPFYLATGGRATMTTKLGVTNLPGPSLTSVAPNFVSQGQSVNITLTGTNFVSGMTIDAGPNITVGNVVVKSTSATATLSIAASAALGQRAITVTTSGGTSNALTFTVNSPSLTLSKAGNGSGTVTSNPAGIDCGATCSTTFTPGQVFALTAIPAAGSIFAGWSGDPDCIDGSVTMTAARNCVVRFDLPQTNSTLLRGDFDGDGKTDIAVYRPATGEWFLRLSSQGYTVAAGNWYFQWGIPGDVPITGDFDGDGKTDISVYRPSTGEWLIRLSTQNYAVAVGNWYFQWGIPGDVPITGDFDHDGKTDIAVYRPSTGEWYIRLSTQNYAVAAGNWYFQWGITGDQPVAGDFDADGKTDIAVYRPSTGEWYIRLSTQNYAIGFGNWYFQWGVPDDQPVAADFDGDGKTDIAVYRPATGEWLLRLSTRNYAVAAGNWYYQWGVPGDVTLRGDFDGDLKTDIAVYRPVTGEWYIRLSTQGYAVGFGNWYYQWGVPGDLSLRR